MTAPILDIPPWAWVTVSGRRWATDRAVIIRDDAPSFAKPPTQEWMVGADYADAVAARLSGATTGAPLGPRVPDDVALGSIVTRSCPYDSEPVAGWQVGDRVVVVNACYLPLINGAATQSGLLDPIVVRDEGGAIRAMIMPIMPLLRRPG